MTLGSYYMMIENSTPEVWMETSKINMDANNNMSTPWRKQSQSKSQSPPTPSLSSSVFLLLLLLLLLLWPTTKNNLGEQTLPLVVSLVRTYSDSMQAMRCIMAWKRNLCHGRMDCNCLEGWHAQVYRLLFVCLFVCLFVNDSSTGYIHTVPFPCFRIDWPINLSHLCFSCDAKFQMSVSRLWIAIVP